MEDGAIMIFVVAMIVGITSVIFGFAIVRIWDRYKKKTESNLLSRRQDIVFLFNNKRISGATPSAYQLLAGVTTPEDDWHRLMSWIGPHFTGAVEKINNLRDGERINLTGESRLGTGKLHLLVEDLGNDILRIVISAQENAALKNASDGVFKQVMEEELQLLREAAEQTPALVWREDKSGNIVWGNTTYHKYIGLTQDGPVGWPLPRLLSPAKVNGPTEISRDKFNVHGKPTWFDCHEHDIRDQKIFYALPANTAVRAERNLRDFVQTLTKTFANLHIGLAIFDRQRNLQLFNPPLIDLMNLPVEFLVARPTLADFLDQLRDQRMVPEPKNFRAWQKQIINLEKLASSGQHIEEWSLSGGQTYRVTGCPHPDGAIAFMFEDITSETVRNRRLQEALILNKQILDALNEGIIVFGKDDEIALVNETYSKLWGEPASHRSDVLADWAKMVTPADVTKLQNAMRYADNGEQSQGKLTLKNGKIIRWLVFQIFGGHSVVCFDPGKDQDVFALPTSVESVKSS